MTEEPRQLIDLQRLLAARDKTIAVLVARIERDSLGIQSSRYSLQQNAGLEAIVTKKTAELEEQRGRLERLVADLRSAQTQLLQAQKLEAIGHLAAGIAHEINTPIQFVGDNLEFLSTSMATILDAIRSLRQQRLVGPDTGRTPPSEGEAPAEVDDDEVDYLLEEIPSAVSQSQHGIERVARIVKAMKDFSHPGGAEMAPADMNAAIETTVTVARNEWKYVADMRLDLDRTLAPVICNVGEINQVILNLVINAAHAIADKRKSPSDPKGVIALATRQESGFTEIRVVDTGAGIPKEHRNRIFDPFFTTKPVGKGTGQGLAIAYNVVVNQHGGTISCQSEVGVGTTFVIRLPTADRESASASAPPGPPDSSSQPERRTPCSA